jgi:hypothetical protein
MESCLCLLFRNILCVQLEFERDRFIFIFFKQEFICSAPSLQLQKEKERFWVNICSIFFSERIYLFSNRHLQPSYTMIKSVLGVGTFFLVLVQLNFEREHI